MAPETASNTEIASETAHAKSGSPNLKVVSTKVFVEAGTLAWQCWQSESRRNCGRGYPTITSTRADK